MYPPPMSDVQHSNLQQSLGSGIGDLISGLQTHSKKDIQFARRNVKFKFDEKFEKLSQSAPFLSDQHPQS